MTSPPRATPPTDLPGPDAESARRVRRLGAGVAAAAVLVAGGTTAAYAASLADDPDATYGTIVDPTTGAPVDGPLQITTDGPVVVPGSAPDCPEHDGGTGGAPGGDSTPEQETSTL